MTAGALCTVQLSYRTMPNLGKLVAGHNTKVTTPATNYGEPNCNCRGKNAVCMIEGSRCMDEGEVYQAEVTADNKPFDGCSFFWNLQLNCYLCSM